MEYKRLPLSKDQLTAMQENSPELYNDMVNKYGLDNVVNNLLVNMVIFQEEKGIYPMGQKKPIDINNLDVENVYIATKTAEELRKIYKATNTAYDKFIAQPINTIKSWIDDTSYLGYVPVVFNHPEDVSKSTKHGYMVGGSLNLIKINDKLCLVCKAVLISPEAKYNYISGLWREVSPTLANNKVHEISFVLSQPAQLGNSTFSSGEVMATIETTGGFLEEIQARIHAAEVKDKEIKIQNELDYRERLAKSLTSSLIKELVITSANREKVMHTFLQLSSGEEMQVVAKTMRDTTSKFGKTPSIFNIQGAFKVDTKTRESYFNEFKELHGAEFDDASALIEGFEKSYKSHVADMQLASGEGSVSKVEPKDKMADVKSMLKHLMEEDTELDDEMKDAIMKLCSGKMGMKLSDGKVGQTDAGGATQPNNAKLSSGEVGSETLIDVYQKALAELSSKFKELELKHQGVN